MTRPRLPAEASLLTHRIVEVPSLDGVANATVAGRTRLLAVAATAHALRQPLVCCWLRARPHGPVAVLVGSGAVGVPGRDGAVAFPPGGRAAALPPNRGLGVLDRVPAWERADLAVDRVVPGGGGAGAPGLDELFAFSPERPMAVLVVGRPLEPGAAQAHLDDLSDLVDELEARRAGRGAERLRLARAEDELRHLEQWATQGFWELEVWTGGGDTPSCRAVAAMIGGSADLMGVPLRVRPASTDAGGGTAVGWSSRRLVAADSLVALARPPARELPGIRVVEGPDLDVTPEVVGEVLLGAVLDATRAPCLPFRVPLDSVNRHVLVTGATGSGKSHTVRTLLAGLSERGIPWLAIEPAKSEYAAMAGRLRATGAQVVVVRPGSPLAAPVSLNPLEPGAIVVGGERVPFPLQTHLDMVRALFTASFQADEPFPQVLAAALARSYEAVGWNLALSRAVDGDPAVAPRYPTLADLERHALAVVDDAGYGREVRDNVRGFVKVRIASLRLGTPGRFFEGGHPLDVDRLLDTNAVFEIEDLGDDNDKAFFIGTVLIRLFEVLRLRHANGRSRPGLAHVTVVEEAHRLLRHAPEGSPAAQAVTMFANLLAEVRAYGEGVVVAEQIPVKVVADVVKNSAVKVMHRLPAEDDRTVVGATMNLTPRQQRLVVSLTPGEAVAHVDGMDGSVLVRVDGDAAAEAVDAVPPRPPVTPRSTTCPAACRPEPCSLETIVLADRLPVRPQLDLWAEVVVLAHLVGEVVGAPGPGWVASVTGDERVVGCAVAHAVDRAVDRRSVEVRRWYDPGSLKREVAEVMRTQLAGGPALGVPDHRWRIGHYRWVEVIRSLEAAPAGDDTDRPHPSTGTWRGLGLDVPGATWADQLLHAREAAARAVVSPCSALGGEPAVIDDLAARLAHRPDREERLRAALRAMGLPAEWPVCRLRPYWRRRDAVG